MGDADDSRGRNRTIELAVAASLVAPAVGCGPTPSTTDTANPEPTPVQATTVDDPPIDHDGSDDAAHEEGEPSSDSQAADGGDEEIPEDGKGDWGNPGSVRG